MLLITLLVANTIPVESVTPDEVRSQLAEAFVWVRQAEMSGGNVTKLITELNGAANLLNAGGDVNVNRASAMITDVISSIPAIEVAGSQAESVRFQTAIISLVILAVMALLVLLYGSKMYWRLWMRVRGDWRVEWS